MWPRDHGRGDEARDNRTYKGPHYIPDLCVL